MKFMGIDPGTNWGWAVEDDSGFFKLPKDPTQRLVDFRHQLEGLLIFYAPTVVGVELVPGNGQYQREVIFGQLGVVRSLADLGGGYAVVPVWAATWKKQVLGQGNISKEETMTKLGSDNEHEADAIGVMRYVKKNAIIGE